jgi:DNA-binding response OmpR family regulator
MYGWLDESTLQVNAKIKELFPNLCIPVIMVSAKSTEDDIVQGLESGSTDYIKKPFQAKELLARIEAQLQIKVRKDTQ